MEEYIVDGFDEPFKVNPNKKNDFLDWAKKNNKTFELKTPEVKISGNQNDPANSATVGSDLSTETNLSQNNQQQNTELISDDTSSELPENDYLNFKNKINNIVNSFYKGNNSIKNQIKRLLLVTYQCIIRIFLKATLRMLLNKWNTCLVLEIVLYLILIKAH